MKKYVLVVVGMMTALELSAYETWTDPKTGIEWTYELIGDEVSVGSGDWNAAVPPETSGAIEIPSEIAGKNVTRIGACAFCNCSGLESVTIPEGVTDIGDNAFSGCGSLTSVTTPLCVTRIGRSAFEGCRGLTSISIPSSTASIGDKAFSGCNGLADEDGFIIVRGVLYGYVGWSVSVTIPSGVTRIEDDAFRCHNGLWSVSIPVGVRSIGGGAFSDCSNLASVEMPLGVLSIGGEAFYSCRSLTSATIPLGVACIERWMFCDCRNLTSVTIPASVKNIEYGAFSLCKSLATVYVSTGDTARVRGMIANSDSKINVNALQFVEKNSITVVFDLGDHGTRVGGGALSQEIAYGQAAESPVVTAEPYWSFAGWNKDFSCVDQDMFVSALYDWDFVIEDGTLLEYRGPGGAVTIPNGATAIGYGVFEGCDSLTAVTIPSTVTQIENTAFRGCGARFVVEQASRTFVVTNDLLCTKDGLRILACPTNLTSAVIPDGITEIGDGAFYDCSALQSVAIPSSVRNIGVEAFYGCNGLASLVISESVTNIGEEAFCECSGLVSLTIPSNVRNIGYRTFLTSVTIPMSVRSIGYSAFGGCNRLTSMIIPPSVTSIEMRAFANCFGLTSVTIPESVTAIEDFVFEGCSGLTSIKIPRSVKSIGTWSFFNCWRLMSIEIPDSVTSIGDLAFYECNRLKWVCVSADDAERIKGLLANRMGWGRDVNSLQFVELPCCTVSFDLGEYGTRSGGGELFQVIHEGLSAEAPLVTAKPYWSFDGWDADFSSITKDLIVRAQYRSDFVIQDGVLVEYKGSGGAVTIPSGVTNIGSTAFSQCKSLTSVVIPEDVTCIGERAFYGCSELMSITLPTNLYHIGAGAFDGTACYASALRKLLSPDADPVIPSV